MRIERGYLRLPRSSNPLRSARLAVPPRFQPPVQVGNWEYLLPPEEQGAQPWCAAYSQCAVLQAAAWRDPRCGYPVQFDERLVYAGAKDLDKDRLDGTSLESVITAAESIYGVVCNEVLVSDPDDIEWVIHQYGVALVGFSIDEGWESPRASDGMITPAGKSLGGHAVVIDWYKRTEQRLGGPNWWGKGWGREGRWSMSYETFRKQWIYGYAQRPEFMRGFPGEGQ